MLSPMSEEHIQDKTIPDKEYAQLFVTPNFIEDYYPAAEKKDLSKEDYIEYEDEDFSIVSTSIPHNETRVTPSVMQVLSSKMVNTLDTASTLMNTVVKAPIASISYEIQTLRANKQQVEGYVYALKSSLCVYKAFLFSISALSTLYTAYTATTLVSLGLGLCGVVEYSFTNKCEKTKALIGYSAFALLGVTSLINSYDIILGTGIANRLFNLLCAFSNSKVFNSLKTDTSLNRIGGAVALVTGSASVANSTSNEPHYWAISSLIISFANKTHTVRELYGNFTTTFLSNFAEDFFWSYGRNITNNLVDNIQNLKPACKIFLNVTFRTTETVRDYIRTVEKKEPTGSYLMI